MVGRSCRCLRSSWDRGCRRIDRSVWRRGDESAEQADAPRASSAHLHLPGVTYSLALLVGEPTLGALRLRGRSGVSGASAFVALLSFP